MEKKKIHGSLGRVPTLSKTPTKMGGRCNIMTI
jgi:hypothetical protein